MPSFLQAQQAEYDHVCALLNHYNVLNPVTFAPFVVPTPLPAVGAGQLLATLFKLLGEAIS